MPEVLRTGVVYMPTLLAGCRMSPLLRLPWGDYITGADITSICVIDTTHGWRVNVEMGSGRVHIGAARNRGEAEGWRDGIADVREFTGAKGVA